MMAWFQKQKDLKNLCYNFFMNNLLIVANIFGYVGLLLLYIQVVFGSRHIFKIFTQDTVKINKIHKYIGIYGTLFVFAHPLISMMNRLESFAWIFTPSFVTETERNINFGRFALILLLIVWITSAIVREKIKWRPWKYIHLLSYPILALSFVHIPQIGSFYEKYAFVRVTWGALFLGFAVSLLMRLLAWSALTKPKFEIIKKEMVGSDIVLMTLKPLGERVSSQIGQHFFLQAGRFKSEHPFTIVRNHDGVLEFGIRKSGKFWEELLSKNVGGQIFLDGPYGRFTKEAQNNKPKVLISGGIGVTPFIDLVENFGENTIYINCNRKIEEAVERDLLKSKSGEYLDIVGEYAGNDTSVKVGLISEDILKEKMGDNIKSLPVFICGSPMFISIVKNMLKNLGVSRENIFYEELGF